MNLCDDYLHKFAVWKSVKHIRIISDILSDNNNNNNNNNIIIIIIIINSLLRKFPREKRRTSNRKSNKYNIKSFLYFRLILRSSETQYKRFQTSLGVRKTSYFRTHFSFIHVNLPYIFSLQTSNPPLIKLLSKTYHAGHPHLM